MTEKPPQTQRPDPLRREPPTIDLKPSEFNRSKVEDRAKADRPKPDAKPDDKPEVRVGETGPSTAKAADPKAADPKAVDPKAADPKASVRKPADAEKPDPKPGAAKPVQGVDDAALAASDGATAIEPMAATSLDASSGEKMRAAGASGTSGSVKPNLPKPSAPATPPSPAKPASSVPPSALPKSAANAAPGDRATSSNVSGAGGESRSAAPAGAKPDETRPIAPHEIRGKATPGAGEPADRAGATRRSDPNGSRPGRGLGALLAAGIVGGLVGAALSLAADIYWVDPSSESLDRRVSMLEQRPAAALGSGASELDRRVAALEATTKTIGGEVKSARTAVSEMQKQPPPSNGSALEDLTRRVAGIENSAKAQAAPGQDLDKLQAQIAGLQSAIGNRTQANAESVKTLQAALQSLQTGGQSLQGDVKAVQGEIGTLQDASGQRDRRLSELDQRLSDVSATLGKVSPDTIQSGLRLVVADRIAADLRAGLAVSDGLAAYEKLGGAADETKALQVYAKTAAPTAASLASAFKPLADKMIEGPRDTTGGLGDRLMRMADRIVTVKAVSDKSGNDVPGLVARIEDALARGALADAAAAWDKLPDGSKAISADWAAQLKRRVAADAAAQHLAADAIAKLTSAAR